MKQTASGTVHLPPPPLLYINAWADGVGTPVLPDSTDDADADSKQVQLMNLLHSEHGDEGAFVYGGVHYSEQWCMVEYRRCKRKDVWFYLPCPDVQHQPATADKIDAVTRFDALLPVPPVPGNSLIIPESQNSQLVHQAAPDSSTGSNPVVLKDWCFVSLSKHFSPGKHLGFRAIGTLVYHPRCVDDSQYGLDWFSTEIQGIQSDCVVVSANTSLYRLEGPAAPARHKAQACLAIIMEPFCQSTWPPNAESLFQQVSKFFLSSHEAKQQPVSFTSSSSLEAGWFTCVCSYMVVYGGVWKCVYVEYGYVWLTHAQAAQVI